jgi:hypothetical protein
MIAGTPDQVVEGLGPFLGSGLNLPIVWEFIGPNRGHSLVVVRGLIDSNRMTSLEIDRWVGERLGNNQGLYLIDEERLREAAPDVILTQGLCDVCAIDYNEVVAASETLAKKPKIVSLTPNCLTDVLDDVARVGEATGQRHIAERFVQELEQRISFVRERAARSSARPRVALPRMVRSDLPCGSLGAGDD